MLKHIFVMGLHPFHLEQIRTIRHGHDYAFHGLLDYDEVVMPKSYSIRRLLRKAERRIESFYGDVAGIITHWDFPASTMVPILAKKYGYRYASLESVLQCEHKYWSRLTQRQVLPDLTPRFCAFDPFADDPLASINLAYPYWIKPIKAFSSHLGFRIDQAEDFQRALPFIREQIPRIGKAFDEILDHARLPDSIRPIDGTWCIAEEIMQGKQCGIEGFVFEGRVAIHGAVDTVKDLHNWSFTRYEYPSEWPTSVQQRMAAAAKKFMQHIGFDNAAFGIEFFWDEEADRLGILEINTRISQSHSKQFIMVEGASNHEVPVDLVLGRDPEFCLNQGKYKTAAKFMLRRYADAVVTRVPTPEELRAVEESEPDCTIGLTVEEGMRLSQLRDQDSYSYEIANVWLGAQSQEELLEKYRGIVARLHFEFSDGSRPEAFQLASTRY